MSGSATDLERGGKSIPLREWTERALETVNISACNNANASFPSSFGADSSSWPVDIRRSLALSSDTYLSSALKVSRSLADQICQAEEGNYNGGGLQQILLPTPGTDWADRVVVHLSNDHLSIDEYKDGSGDVEPLPFPPQAQELSSDPRELQAMLNSLIPDESLFTREDNDEGEHSDETMNTASYHNVARAEISPSPKDGNMCGGNDKMQRIYSLGIAFYELFSGGERHPDITPQSSDSNPQDNIEPIPHDQAYEPGANGDSCSTFDLEGKLNILDRLDGDIGDDFFENLESTSAQTMPKKKKRPHQINGTMCSISVEPLKLKGLPSSLCVLIGNMIDCINGDLSGDEAYLNMSDVRSDLQLMLEKPHRFLHDLDLDKLAVTGLQLNEAVFGRDADFSVLKDSYRRSISGENELGIVVGQSGIGKSVLARRLGSFVTATGGLFISGKFDQLASTPFSALASAFNEYCDKMSKEGGLQEVASRLRIALGEEARHLIKVIPNLSAILGDDSGTQDEDQDCVDAQKRLQYLLCQFVDVISSVSGAPLTLFLDDLQWADPASINAINQLLMISGSWNAKRRFFFLGSCREEGMLAQHPFGNMLSNIRKFGIRATIVELACMDKEATNTMVSDLLCLSPRLTRSLAVIIHHKTKGNMLFFSQLMISLCKDDLVRLSLSRRRWIWDIEKIQNNRKLPDDVTAFLTSAIGRLPKEVQDALCTLSCFGSSLESSIIAALEAQFGNPLIKSLDIAVAEGLLDKINETYSFGHDRLHEAAYNMIKPVERPLFHFKYGVALVPRALELQDDSLLFLAAGQINRGGPSSVEDAEQGLLIANLNLRAGHKAMEMSDFSSAFSFFDNGISFLRKRHWKEHYDLSLSLFDAASECALAIGDAVSLQLLSEQVIRFAKTFEDSLNSMYSIVCCLAYASNLPESVERSIVVLRECLGEELPESLSETDLKFHIEQTKVMLQKFTDKDLIEYKVMGDPSKLMAMKFYARLELSFQMIRPALQPIATMKMVQLTIAHGMSPMSPIGLTYFGQLTARLGDIKEGCRYVKIAMALLDRIGSKEVAGEVIAVGTQIMSFVDPVQATLEFHVQGQASAMSTGNIHAALLNCALHVATSFWAGTKLPVCKKLFDNACRIMREHGHLTFLSHIINMEKYFLLLMNTEGNTDQTSSFSAAEMQAARDLQEVNPSVGLSAYLQKMYLSFMVREYEHTKALAEKYFDFNVLSWTLSYYHTAQSFYGGLVSFWIYRQSNDAKWSERGRKAKVAMRNWAESSHHNFQHKSYLLEAEEAYSYKDIEGAKSLYEKAVSTAREHRFVNDEALACELAGYFFLEISDEDTALQYFMQAHERYHEWGAVAKSNALFEFVQQVLCGLTASPSPGVSVSLSDTPISYQDDNVGNSNRRKRFSE